ncbi:MAG: potassium-transporting ATPase subunit KdpA [Simkaniaceae bacterium]|nr:potassium-transporting ATPase subunit KdpA [Simkaniaceae bacterium]
MGWTDWLHFILFILIILFLTKPFGLYIERVLDPKKRTLFDPILKPVEHFVYRLCNISPLKEQTWKEYLVSIGGFSFISLVFTSLLLACQYYLPLNPENFTAPSWHLNLNVAFSFMTNTDWQSYGGESTMSYFSQMTALTVQNFVSAAVGLAVAAALVRGIARKTGKTIGNFWADLVRINLYLLLLLSILAATLFISEGVPQNFKSYVQAKTIEGRPQTLVQGPIASQQAIKLLGTNGGGYTNANSAHPYENPTPLANLLQLILIFLIPSSQIYYFGRAIKNTKHAWCIITALGLVFIAGVLITAHAEITGNPSFASLGLTGGNWEGKETRFGIFASSLYACVTTVISCGAVNCVHDSLTPIGGLIPLLNMELSEVIFGGVGAGLYSILIFVFLTIFISGLIIGRTPEYLGKKIEAFDVKMTVLATLPFVLLVHGFTAWSCFSTWGLAGLGNSGPHGFSEMLYAFSSGTANNGSAFAGLSANTLPYNLTLAAAMFFGRFLVIAPVMALAGSLITKKVHPQNSASFPISSFVFISLLIGVILLIGALTFLPALTMGPIIEQFFMLKGKLFS